MFKLVTFVLRYTLFKAIDCLRKLTVQNHLCAFVSRCKRA